MTMTASEGNPAAGRGTGDLRVGVVGLGWAGVTHAESYQLLPDVSVAAMAGLEDDRAADDEPPAQTEPAAQAAPAAPTSKQTARSAR